MLHLAGYLHPPFFGIFTPHFLHLCDVFAWSKFAQIHFFFQCFIKRAFFLSEYLIKIPSLKILRVYSDQIEQKEFPIPNKLKPARITRSEDELKMSSEKIRSVSLHQLIRSGVCPYAEELRTFEEGFAEDKARGEPISEDDVDKYCKVGSMSLHCMKKV